MAQPSFSARVNGGAASYEVPCERVGRTGLFLRTGETPPPLLSDVSLVLRLPGGDLPCKGQVVRHVSALQAQAWNMSPGFGVQLLDASAAFEQSFARLLSGVPPQPVTPAAGTRDEPRVEPLLREFRRRLEVEGDHYALLGLARHADSDAVRTQARELRIRLEAALALPLSARQRELTQVILKRVAEALHVLGHLERRLEYDALLRNADGVLRCLASGLTISTLEACRKRFLERHPGVDGHALIHLTTGDAFLKADQPNEALASYEAALKADPLHLEALKRWHTLRVKLRGGTTGAARPATQ
jgi:serine/threonine-protein kinase